MLEGYSLSLIRADLKQFKPTLWDNVKCCMDASNYGIAVFEQIDERDINPNISLELGYMLSQGKKCLLLKEKRVPTLPSDLVGHLYRNFDSYDIEKTIKHEVENWLKSDLGYRKKSNERLLVFISTGGTCRCAMAKAITRRLIQDKNPDYKLRIESYAKGSTSGMHASHGAREAIKELYGEDLLKDHRPKELSEYITEEADLILVMNDFLRKGLPGKKTRPLKQFLGINGELDDPWPDDRDDKAAIRYRNCANELEELLRNNIDKIIDCLKHPESIPDFLI
jgi:protein-tyrosine-phosphatase